MTSTMISGTTALTLAAVAWAAPAAALVISTTPIPPIAPIQFQTTITGGPGGCNFANPGATLAACTNGNGSWRLAPPGQYDLSLENLENLANQKTLRLEIVLNNPGNAIDFEPIADTKQLPELTDVTYSDPSIKSKNKINVSFLKAENKLQMQWEIYPQPALESIQFENWKMKVGGQVTAFSPDWLKSVSLASHCPEPATWALMLAGFGCVGGALRTRRRGTA